MKKTITIIIPTYNSEKYISESLKSLKKQTYKNYSVFIADGGSKDRTLSLIKKSNLKYKIISKKDKSFEEGVNKCFDKLKTEYIMILGSDDSLIDKNYLSKLLITMKDKNCDIIFPEYGVIINNKKKVIPQPKSFNQLTYKTVVPGLGWIAKTKSIKNVKYNTKIRIATDYDIFLRLYINKKKFYRSKSTVYYFRIGGNSYKSAIRGFNEQKMISIKHKGPLIKIYYVYFMCLAKFIIKYLLLGRFFKVSY